MSLCKQVLGRSALPAPVQSPSLLPDIRQLYPGISGPGSSFAMVGPKHVSFCIGSSEKTQFSWKQSLRQGHLYRYFIWEVITSCRNEGWEKVMNRRRKTQFKNVAWRLLPWNWRLSPAGRPKKHTESSTHRNFPQEGWEVRVFISCKELPQGH